MTFMEGETQNMVLSASGRKRSLYRLNGTGTLVTFHKNGSPLSYHSISNNRLFGWQAEWDENGKVVTSENLDIPKERADEEFPRLWGSANGKSTLIAKIRSVADNVVVLENADGKRARVKIENLSEADRDYLDAWNGSEVKP